MPWSVIAGVALVAAGLTFGIWLAWHQHQHHKQADAAAAAVDGHRLTAGCVRVGDRHEVQLVDESTGHVVARLTQGDAGRLAGELVNAAMLTNAHSPPGEAEPDQPGSAG